MENTQIKQITFDIAVKDSVTTQDLHVICDFIKGIWDTRKNMRCVNGVYNIEDITDQYPQEYINEIFGNTTTNT